jgi:hypothetical protein
MRKIKAIAIFNALTFILQLVFSYLAQAGNLGSETVSSVSAKYETMVTPAGMTFAIWGIIYTSLAVLCLYHIVMAYKHDLTNPANHEAAKMGSLFIIVNLAAAAWLVAWTREMMVLTVVLMLTQLVGLILLHIKLGIYSLSKAASVKVATEFPLAIYLGWISMATIANISSFLSAKGWDGFGIAPYQWGIIIIIVAVLLSSFIILFRRNMYFGLVTAWFLFGLIKKREGNPAEGNEILVTSAWIGLGLVLALAIFQLVKNITYKKPGEIFPVAGNSLK